MSRIALTCAIALSCAALAVPAIAAAPTVGTWTGKTVRAKGKVLANVSFMVDPAGNVRAMLGYQTGRCSPKPFTGLFFETYDPAPVKVRGGSFVINAPHTTVHDDGVKTKVKKLRVSGRFTGSGTAKGTFEMRATTRGVTCVTPKLKWTAKPRKVSAP